MGEINFDELHVETLTIQQTAQIFRDVGIATTEEKIRNGIEQGLFPFGVIVRSDKGNVMSEIYTRQVYEYLKARAVNT